MHFFDQYPQLYESGVAPSANRLRCRYEAIIAANAGILGGARVLDVASHNGRWSFAAVLGAGASYSLGVEPRKTLVDSARQLADNLQVADKVDFRQAKINDYLDTESLAPDTFDVVMCNGFFYHTCDHFQLLREFRRLAPYLILDTEVAPQSTLGIFYRREQDDHIGRAVSDEDDNSTLVGTPTVAMLGEMFRAVGFQSWQFFDWKGKSHPSQDGIERYIQGNRVTVLVTR